MDVKAEVPEVGIGFSYSFIPPRSRFDTSFPTHIGCLNASIGEGSPWQMKAPQK